MKALLTLLLLAGLSVAADTSYPSQSLYNLQAPLTTQLGQQIGLDAHAGQPVLITMFYGSCPLACPLLIDTLRALERAADATRAGKPHILLISIDPQRDTVAALSSLAAVRHLDAQRWTLARTDASHVRKLAAMLNVQYRQLPDGSYNHSSVITLLTARGEIAAQSSVIGKADPQLLQALPAAANQ